MLCDAGKVLLDAHQPSQRMHYKPTAPSLNPMPTKFFFDILVPIYQYILVFFFSVESKKGCKVEKRLFIECTLDAAQLVRGIASGVENMQFRASHISKSLKWAIKQNSPA